MSLTKLILFLLLCSVAFRSGAEIYKWIDAEGNVYFSDQKPVSEDSSEPALPPLNVMGNSEPAKAKNEAEDGTYRKDDFRLPALKSKVPFRFILTSSLNADEPGDRLSSIKIDADQKNFIAYVKLTGVDSGKDYSFRIRILDAKGELVFDKEEKIRTGKNSLSFAASISPHVSIDAPGSWTFQGILDRQTLFVEKREILF